jgi:hypothetical protein
VTPTTPAPAKFAAQDAVIRSRLPAGIADLKSIVAAADKGDADGIFNAAQAYIRDMRPTVTGALHEIDPRWPNE